VAFKTSLGNALIEHCGNTTASYENTSEDADRLISYDFILNGFTSSVCTIFIFILNNSVVVFELTLR